MQNQEQEKENVIPLAMSVRRPASFSLPTHVSSGSGPSLVPFPRWQKACDRVSAALLGGESRVVVTGPPGTGKTLLLDHIARVLRAAGWTVILQLADPAPPPPGRHSGVVLLIDEADRIAREALQRLLATAPCPLVLAGLDVLQSRAPGATQIVLSPLGREEARDYIAHWLALTGRTPANLEAAAMRRTIEISGGVPRLTSTLLGAAAWLAESSEEARITVQHVEEAAALRSCFVSGDNDMELHEERRERTNTPILVAVAAAMLLLGAGAYIATRYYPAETERAIGTIRETVAQTRSLIDERLNGPAPTKPAPTKLAAASPPPVIQPRPIPMRDAAPPPVKPAAPALDLPKPAAPAADLPKPLPKPLVAPEAPKSAPAATVFIAPSAKPAPATPVVAAADTVPPPIPTVFRQTLPSVASPPPSLAIAPPAEVPVAAPPPKPIVVASALPPETISLLVRRGNDMMAIGDVSAARLLFGRAAEAGDPDAMVAMGRTFDATILAQSSPLLPADPAEAARWYRRAAVNGNKAANDLLNRLESRPAR